MTSQILTPGNHPIRLLEWNVKAGASIKHGTVLGVYRNIQDPSKDVVTKETHLKSRRVGIVRKILVNIGQVATPGCPLIELEGCSHPVVMKDMCAECGEDLRKLEVKKENARVSMIPNIPELKISAKRAEELGFEDEKRLQRMRKLVLLVDLDQTLIHTSQNPVFSKWCDTDDNDFFTYQLSKNEPTLYTKLRPQCREFIDTLSSLFELQVVTFGSRQYAHKIAEFIDPEKKYFANRILSRDECVNPMRKSGNLRHLFPCGDSMVCIIDDRSDVWNNIPNLILVNKYSYFPGAGDINSPDKIAESQNKENADSPSEASRKRKSANEDEIMCKVMKLEKDPNHGDSEPTDAISKTVEAAQNEITQAEHNEVTDPEQQESDSGEQNIDDDLNLSSDSSNSSDSNDIVSNNASNNENNAISNENSAINNEKDVKNNEKDVKNNEKDVKNKENDIKNNKKDVKNNKKDIKNNEKVVRNNENDNTGNNDNGFAKNNEQHLCNNVDKELSNQVSASNISQKPKVPSSNPPTDYDDYLEALKTVLTLIHSTYYEAYDKYVEKTFNNKPDLRGVIPFLRSKILYGCKAVLTAVIPNNCKGTPQQHKAYVTLEQLGGTIQQVVTEETTHLIAGTKGTRKYQDATKYKHIHFVSPEWLWACSERWEKMDERLFPIPEDGNKRGTSPVPKKKERVRTYDKVTGKVVREHRVSTVRKQRENQIYSSLMDPEIVVPIAISNPDEPSTSNGRPQVRERKPSMVELFGEYALSSIDLEDMDREVDDLLSGDDETPEVGEKIGNNSDSSSSDDEFDHMADLLDHEMNYDVTEDMDDVD